MLVTIKGRSNTSSSVHMYRKEHYARQALNQHDDNLDKARQFAETEFRHFVRRDLSAKEIRDLHTLIDELHDWKIQSEAPAMAV